MPDQDAIARLNKALEGRYRIERQLGEGGMATVYLVQDLKHERKVALKVLRPELAAVIGAERFLSEIKTTANLQHPHILPLFDSGEASGYLYYVMPYIDGETLREKLDREKQLGVEESVRIARDVADALDYAHRNGVIHRDIKPGNVLLHDGRPVVADFGIALAVSAAGGGRMTETGLSLGTPHYMSPEQASADRDLTARSDVYSLGCVLYEMLAGQPPHTGPSAQSILVHILTEDPKPLSAVRHTVPPHVAATVSKAIEKLPADRFETARAFLEALADEGFRYRTSRPQPHAVGLLPDEPSVAPGPWRRVSAGLGVLLVASLAGLGWFQLRPVPAAPVMRFESPFRPGQEPVVLGVAGFGLSPDGSFIVYQGPSPDERLGQLWIRRWDDPEATPIRGTEDAAWPSISPDGRRLVFVRGGEVTVVPLEGGSAPALTRGNASHWGSDGYIYYTGVDVGELGNAMRVLPSSGANPELVSAASADQRFVRQVLPSGRGALVVVVKLGGSPEIHVLDLRTGELRWLADGNSPAYATTGHLVYVSNGNLMAARFDSDEMMLSGPPAALESDVSSLALSPTGALVYAAGGSAVDPDAPDTELVWVTRTGEVSPVDSGWAFDRGGANEGWSLSPDGGRIALRLRQSGNNDIWIKDVSAGTPPIRLTFDETTESLPIWSPGDGEIVTYLSGELGGEMGVRSRRVDGTGQATAVFDGGRAYGQIRWSPDGDWLLLRSSGFGGSESAPGTRDILGFRPGADSVPIPLVASAEYAEQDPAVSGDIRWLAYTSNETGRSEVFVRPFPSVDDGKWQVSTGGGWHPLWSHDGRELFYFRAGDSGTEVRSVRFDGSGAGFRRISDDLLFDLPPEVRAPSAVNAIDLSRDDQRFLLARSYSVETSAEGAAPKLIFVQSFFEVIRQSVPAD